MHARTEEADMKNFNSFLLSDHWMNDFRDNSTTPDGHPGSGEHGPPDGGNQGPPDNQNGGMPGGNGGQGFPGGQGGNGGQGFPGG